MSTTAATGIPTGTWNVDPAHSSVEFRVKHLGIATVTGRFHEFEGTMEMREDLASSSARGVVKAASIDTDEPQRDERLRSPDFFDVGTTPTSRPSRLGSSRWATASTASPAISRCTA